METITGCEHLTDNALLERARELAARERENTEALLRHLSEIGHRKLHEREGHASVFTFCRLELRLSEAESWRRSVAAKAARRYPLIFEKVGSGELNLAVVAAIAPHLTAANYRTVLRRCAGKSRRQVDAMVADLAGQRETRDRVRMVAAVRPQPEPGGKESGAGEPGPLPETPAGEPRPLPEAPAGEPSPLPETPAARPGETKRAAAPAASIEPPAARRVEIKFTADEDLWRRLQRIRELLRFRIAGDRLEHVVAVLAELWLEKHDPERTLRRERRRLSRAGRKQTPSRRVPSTVKTEVYRRDGGRCSFISPSGKRCSETARLEFDHRVPFALGGRSDDPAGIRLLCRAHNLRAAREAGLGRGGEGEGRC